MVKGGPSRPETAAATGIALTGIDPAKITLAKNAKKQDLTPNLTEKNFPRQCRSGAPTPAAASKLMTASIC